MSLNWCYAPPIWRNVSNETQSQDVSSPENSSQHSEFLDSFIKAMNGPGTTAIVLLGLVSISISLCVLCRSRHRPLIYLYLIYLESWNILLLTSAFLLYSLPHILYGQQTITGPYAYSYLYSYVASNLAMVGTVWSVLALTVDRYVALCHPLRHKAMVTRGSVIRFLATLSLLAFLFNLPRYFEIEINTCILPEPPFGALIVVGTTPMRSQPVYNILYKIVGALLLTSLVPFVTILLLTVRIGYELRKSRMKRRSMSSVSGKEHTGCAENASNTMLMAVTVKFLLSHSMPTILDLAELIIGHEAFTKSMIANSFVTVSALLLVFNASSNLYIFLWWGPRFRRELRAFLFLATPPADRSTGILLNGDMHSLHSGKLSRQPSSRDRSSFRSKDQYHPETSSFRYPSSALRHDRTSSFRTSSPTDRAKSEYKERVRPQYVSLRQASSPSEFYEPRLHPCDVPAQLLATEEGTYPAPPALLEVFTKEETTYVPKEETTYVPNDETTYVPKEETTYTSDEPPAQLISSEEGSFTAPPVHKTSQLLATEQGSFTASNQSLEFITPPRKVSNSASDSALSAGVRELNITGSSSEVYV